MSSDLKIEIFDAAIDAGAAHFIRKPIEGLDDIAIAIRQASFRKASERMARQLLATPWLPSELADRAPDGVLCSQRERKTLVGMAAFRDVPLVIYGESGTGKEEMAKLVYRERCRLEGPIPFVAVNCANLAPALAVSELFGHKAGSFSGARDTTQGYVGAANGGILFLDEIQALSPECQRMILRVLQDKKFNRLGDTKLLHSDFQLIAASTKDLDDEVESGRFLIDLRIRITGMELRLAPLRERLHDIPHLIALYFAKSELVLQEPHFERLVAQCQSYYWQGNIRQLYQVLSMMVVNFKINGTPIRAETMPDFKSMHPPNTRMVADHPIGLLGEGMSHLEQAVLRDIPLNESIAALEKIIIAAALKRHPSLTAAYSALGISRSSLDLKRRKYSI